MPQLRCRRRCARNKHIAVKPSSTDTCMPDRAAVVQADHLQRQLAQVPGRPQRRDRSTTAGSIFSGSHKPDSSAIGM